MTQKQHDKHHAEKFAVAKLITESELDESPSSPDGLGAWEGGPAALKGANNWVSQKSHTSRTADAKNTPGTDYASKLKSENMYKVNRRIAQADESPKRRIDDPKEPVPVLAQEGGMAPVSSDDVATA